MDSLTQAVLGAAVGDLTLGHRLGRKGMFWGAFFGTLPDLDVLLFPLADAVSQLHLHRGISHSLLICALAPMVLGPLLSRLWRRQNVTTLRAATFVFLAWSTHVLIDVFTAYGTQILEPFSSIRVTTSTLFIIDPLFTLPLVVSLLVSAWRHRNAAQRSSAIKATRLGIIFASIYTLWSFAAKAWIDHSIQSSLASLPSTPTRHITGPTPLNTLLWRIVAQTDDAFFIGFRSVLDAPETPVRWTQIARQQPPTSPTNPHAYAVLRWFTEDWCITRTTDSGLYIADLRLGELFQTNADGQTAIAPVFAWLLSDPDSPAPFQTTRPAGTDLVHLLRQITQRALGDASALPEPALLQLTPSQTERLPEP